MKKGLAWKTIQKLMGHRNIGTVEESFFGFG
jgi:site-specific recombinase XerD